MASIATINLENTGGVAHRAVTVACGGQTTCVILSDGGLKCFGRNLDGMLGQGTESDIGAGINDMTNLQPVNLGTGKTASAVSIGPRHTCAILNDVRSTSNRERHSRSERSACAADASSLCARALRRER